MPNVFQPSFWDEEEAGLWNGVAELLLSIFLTGIDGGINAMPPSVRVLADFDRVNTRAMEFAKQYRFKWIKDITETTRIQTQKAMSDWIQSGAPLDALSQALEPIYGEKRAERIAVTEATRVFSQANMEAWESTGIIDETVWMTAQDDLVCPICGELNGTHVGIGDIDAAPPAHPNCRCWLQPVVSEDALGRKLDQILSE